MSRSGDGGMIETEITILTRFDDIMKSIKEKTILQQKKRMYEYILAETKEASDELLKSVGDLKKKRY